MGQMRNFVVRGSEFGFSSQIDGIGLIIKAEDEAGNNFDFVIPSDNAAALLLAEKTTVGRLFNRIGKLEETTKGNWQFMGFVSFPSGNAPVTATAPTTVEPTVAVAATAPAPAPAPKTPGIKLGK